VGGECEESGGVCRSKGRCELIEEFFYGVYVFFLQRRDCIIKFSGRKFCSGI